MTFFELLWRVVGALAIVGGSALLGGWLSVMLSVAATRRGISVEASRAIEASVPVGAVVLGAVFGLEHLFGLPPISVSVTFGALVGALGLAAVPVLANVAVGLAHRLREPLAPGARVTGERFRGVVESADALGLRLQTDGDRTFVPWLWLLVQPVVVGPTGARQAVGVPVRVGLESELDELSARLVAATAGVDGASAPWVEMREISARGVEMVVRADVDDERRDEVRSAMVAALVVELRDAGVEIAA